MLQDLLYHPHLPVGLFGLLVNPPGDLDGRREIARQRRRQKPGLQFLPILPVPPDTTVFADVEEAKRFVFDLDGSCGYDYRRDMLSFQQIDYPPWILRPAVPFFLPALSRTPPTRRA